MPDGDTGAGSVSTAEEAIIAAQGWLTVRDLLPADCAVAPAAWPEDPDLPDGVYGSWIVRFQRHLDGVPVGSFWISGVRLALDGLGGVLRMTYVHREIERAETVPLRSVAAAWAELQATASPAYVDTSFPCYGSLPRLTSPLPAV